MDSILQTAYWNVFSWMKTFEFYIKIALKYVPYGLMDNKPALIQIVAWRWTVDKPLSLN